MELANLLRIFVHAHESAITRKILAIEALEYFFLRCLPQASAGRKKIAPVRPFPFLHDHTSNRNVSSKISTR